MPLMERVDDEILKLLNEIIVKDLKDPRLNTLISVTSVNTSKDLKTAKVYVGSIPTELARTGGNWVWKGVTFNLIEK